MTPRHPVILGIETSCDETAAAVVRGSRVLSNIISSQAVHAQWGGVVPELASRAHQALIVDVVTRALEEAGVARTDLGAVAATVGPGLMGALLVGASFGQAFALGLGVPFVGVNHLEGHLWAPRLHGSRLTPPFVGLIVSGGHTQLVLVRDVGRYRLLGRTRDDAAGEAFDKVAKLLDLGYPGGPAIERLAADGDPAWHRFPPVGPRGDTCEFSFSGLKTAVLYFVRGLAPAMRKAHRADICAAFQQTVVTALVTRARRAMQRTGLRTLVVTGGVAANRALQRACRAAFRGSGTRVLFPPPVLCTDNGAMIAGVAALHLQRGPWASEPLQPRANLALPYETPGA